MPKECSLHSFIIPMKTFFFLKNSNRYQINGSFSFTKKKKKKITIYLHYYKALFFFFSFTDQVQNNNWHLLTLISFFYQIKLFIYYFRQ